jgi:N-acylneuraminate cytidylyltransferase
MNRLAVIPARGGSKRLPGKNIRNFLGRPVIARSIDAAISSGLFSEVMVSTNSAEIARVAQSCGASVPFMRSEANADDFATIADVLAEVLEQYRSEGRSFDALCCILPAV